MSEVDEAQAQQEQHNETTADVEIEGTVQPAVETESEAEVEEYDIVLAGQDEPQTTPQPKQSTDYILDRLTRKKNKQQDEIVRLRQQVEQSRQPAQQQPVQSQALQPRPDEFSFDNREDYLKADAVWQQQMMQQTIAQQLNQQQNGHRIAAQEQQDEQALISYAENAAKLKVSDFNNAQDKAFDILGDDFANLIARQLPQEGPKLMYWFSKNPREAAKYRDDFQANPGQTTFNLGMLAGKLKPEPKRSKAAAPETKVESASVGGGQSDWQRQYDQIMDKADSQGTAKTMRQMRELKKKAKASGYDVSTLK